MKSLRQKLWLGFGGLLMVVVAVSVLSIIVLTHYSHILEQVFHENYNSALYCDNMREALDELNDRAQRMIWQEEAARRIDPSPQEIQFTDNLSLQSNNVTLPGEGELTGRLSDQWRACLVSYHRFDEATASERPELYRDDLLPRYQQIKLTALRISDMNMSNMVSVDGRAKQTLVGVRNALLILVMGGTLLAFIVVSAVAATILQPLRGLIDSARQVEKGNLDLQVDVNSRDEIGQLGDAFNAMSGKLREFRRLDHEKLLRTQQTTQLAIDSLPDAVFVIGPDGKIEISNRSAQSHFGIQPGLTVAELALKWLTPLHEEVCRTGKSVEPQRYESAIQLFEAGQELLLLPRAVPMIGETGRILGVTVILVDVTRLHSADEAKSGLVSTVSHELRTPLTGIRMSLGLLSGDKFGPVTVKQTALLKAAREESDRLYRIVENLLSISRMESGRAQFQLRPMAPGELISQAVDPLRGSFAEKQIRLEVETDADLPNVMVDPHAIGSALTNLLSNALKFTPPSGVVEVSACSEGGWVWFTVSDNGPGIPEQYSARVFDKFFRVPRTDGPSGAGLGLAIAREVVIAHGGKIELCRNGHPGSTFRFSLPVEMVESQAQTILKTSNSI